MTLFYFCLSKGFQNSEANQKVLNERSKRSTDKRSKRQIDRQLIEDGKPIVINEGYSRGNGSGSADNRQNTEGLRVYESLIYSNSIQPSMKNGRKVYLLHRKNT